MSFSTNQNVQFLYSPLEIIRLILDINRLSSRIHGTFLIYHVATFVCGLTLAAPFFILQHRIINSPNTAMKSKDDT